ncbi:MAG TPA: ATP-binding protein [Bacteriovoracaceae bacterium]|nr:ATP-binding protein [Bacteriovoracaceae bacterium]
MFGIRRIIENLCNNAIKYVSPHTPVTVRIDEDKDFVYLKVHNEGRVIPLRQQEKLFDPFKRAEGRTVGQEGWGVGLTLVKGQADAHDGSVSVESTLEKGTTFTVGLPNKR